MFGLHNFVAHFPELQVINGSLHRVGAEKGSGQQYWKETYDFMENVLSFFLVIVTACSNGTFISVLSPSYNIAKSNAITITSQPSLTLIQEVWFHSGISEKVDLVSKVPSVLSVMV